MLCRRPFRDIMYEGSIISSLGEITYLIYGVSECQFGRTNSSVLELLTPYLFIRQVIINSTSQVITQRRSLEKCHDLPHLYSQRFCTHFSLCQHRIMAEDGEPMEDHSSVVDVSITHSGKAYSFSLDADATLETLSQHVASELSIPPENQKYIIRPKPGLVKPPFASHPELVASNLAKLKITILGQHSCGIDFADQHDKLHAG